MSLVIEILLFLSSGSRGGTATRWRRDRSVVERCPMTRDASTAAGGCLTDRTIMPALPMPYNGGRVVFASRASSPDEGRDAYAK
jgi:hypothetical protein